MDIGGQILVGDVMDMLATLPSNHVDCVVTSPPYWGLRDYGVPCQIGLEPTPELFIGHMRMVFEQVRRVLKPEGTLWLNLGDSYASSGGTGHQGKHGQRANRSHTQRQLLAAAGKSGLKPKDLCGIPWRMALALQADGWYLRQDIIWHKPNPMPESVRDRCTKAHEYIFLLAKSERYHFDIDAIKEPSVCAHEAKWAGDSSIHSATRGDGKSTRRFSWKGSEFHRGKTGEHQLGRSSKNRSGNKKRKPRPGQDTLSIGAQAGSVPWEGFTRQKRSVWKVSTKPFKGAHFATFPPDLIEPCILAGCPKDGIVLDPFFGAGTTGVVAKKLGRQWIGIELNPKYAKMAEDRINSTLEKHNALALEL